jgi:hypothetical protein
MAAVLQRGRFTETNRLFHTFVQLGRLRVTDASSSWQGRTSLSGFRRRLKRRLGAGERGSLDEFREAMLDGARGDS